MYIVKKCHHEQNISTLYIQDYNTGLRLIQTHAHSAAMLKFAYKQDIRFKSRPFYIDYMKINLAYPGDKDEIIFGKNGHDQ